MNSKVQKGIFAAVVLLIAVLLFTVIDHSIHGMESAWSVPDYYFKDKIPAAFFWGIIGLMLARKSRKIWLKSLIVSGIIAVTLQVRYFLEGYPAGFVLLFLLIHFLILYALSIGMFTILKKYAYN